MCEHRMWFIQTTIRTPPSASAKGGFLKAGAAIRTPDLHVGNRLVSDQKRALRVSSGVHTLRLVRMLSLVHEDAESYRPGRRTRPPRRRHLGRVPSQASARLRAARSHAAPAGRPGTRCQVRPMRDTRHRGWMTRFARVSGDLSWSMVPVAGRLEVHSTFQTPLC